MQNKIPNFYHSPNLTEDSFRSRLNQGVTPTSAPLCTRPYLTAVRAKTEIHRRRHQQRPSNSMKDRPIDTCNATNIRHESSQSIKESCTRKSLCDNIIINKIDILQQPPATKEIRDAIQVQPSVFMQPPPTRIVPSSSSAASGLHSASENRQ